MLRFRLILTCLLSAAAALSATAGPAAAADADAVNDAMAKAQKWLLSQQKDGNWESWKTGYDTQQTGWTALALDALLSSGVSSQDPAIVPAIKYLQATPTEGTYALGLRMQVWQRLPVSVDVHRAALADARKLIDGVGRKGESAGMYGYEVGKGGYSHSRSQYGVLGAAAARQMGIDVPDAYWKLLKINWLDHQLEEGGWTYTKAADAGHPPTAGMTTAGVASLFLTEEALHDAESLECRGTTAQPQLARGLKWLADHGDEIANGNDTARNYPFAALYGVERVGAAGGIKYFGTVDWYRKGADWLLKLQKPEGDWVQAGDDDSTMSPLVDTSFALLFLAHGRAPIFMNKLDYSGEPVHPADKPAGWNQRPRDVANLAKRTGEALEQELNWQVVTLASPVSDYHDAPILYLSGTEPLKLTTDAKTKLRDFIDGGGMIVANADCGGIGFATSVRKLATEITPYEFKTLPPNHPIFTRQQYPAARWKTKPSLLGLSNGVRELMILIPNGDPGKTWELGEVKGRESTFELGADLFEYVTSRTALRFRGESYVVDRDESVIAATSIKLGRIQYGGNWNPEPGGWLRLANVMHNRLKTDLEIQTIPINAPVTGVTVAHMTGTQIVQLSEEPRKHLLDFVSDGGTLIVDAAGGSTEFAAAMRAELSRIFGREAEIIPIDDPLYTAGAAKLATVHYRAFASDTRGKLNQPRIEGIRVGNRIAVFFSADDLSAGLVGQQVDGIIGYDPDCAADLMQRMLLYAAKKP